MIAVAPETLVRTALARITEHNISQLPVILDGECVGHVSEATLMTRVLESPGLLDEPVRKAMDPPLPVVDSHAELHSVTGLLTRQNPAVLVRREGDIAGIITRYDVLRHMTGIN